jgi:hypothetical protein
MSDWKAKKMRLTERDFEFLVETRSPEVSDKWKLKQILREDEDFRKSFILSDVFQELDENFQIAQKPLNYIADHYLRYRRDALFD